MTVRKLSAYSTVSGHLPPFTEHLPKALKRSKGSIFNLDPRCD